MNDCGLMDVGFVKSGFPGDSFRKNPIRQIGFVLFISIRSLDCARAPVSGLGLL